jgi:hypothetical protein
MIRYIGARIQIISFRALSGLVGLLGVGWCGGGFRGLARFVLLTDETIAGAKSAGLAFIISNAIGGIVSAYSGAVGADVIHTFGAGREVYATGEIVLGHGGTIEMRTGGEGAANAKDNSKRQNGPFDFFHTKLFLVITMG